ncbi:hypothetical protein BN2476_520119 [Paraburkholderia piptadeniae]|uniref:Uncharacterized protein n=1 Tax=Paraburkholderia piptadeniae TaxID=1701573 RepID=A0A1N7SHK0_9BURK|nr:hypothetical protein BN2476_520119 [Paraburkholderia piptadeniae]
MRESNHAAFFIEDLKGAAQRGYVAIRVADNGRINARPTRDPACAVEHPQPRQRTRAPWR